MRFKSFFIAVLAVVLVTFPIFAQKGKFNSGSIKSNIGTIQPQYQIIDIGLVKEGDAASQGLGVSDGGIGVGRSVGSGSNGFTWTQANGIVGLPKLTGRTFCLSAGANDTGFVVGTCSNSFSGLGRLPVIWQGDTVMQLPLPAGQTIGDANDVNASGVAVGSVNGGTAQRGVIYSNGNAEIISETTKNGSFFSTAFKINNTGRVIGSGIDPNNASRNVGMVYDIGSNTAFEVGALTNANGAIAFGLSSNGFVVGSSMQNQGSGLPFIWSDTNGIQAIPLPTGTSSGSARGVNSDGWAVGTASSSFAIPFLYDGTSTYRLQDLIPADSDWDLSMNTSSAAQGISDNGIIIGTGLLNGQIHAFAMVPAAPVSIGGRIMTANGYGIRNAQVKISGGGLSASVYVYTGVFGYYNFQGLTPGVEYTVSVIAGRNTFSEPTQMITPSENVSDFDFIAEQ